MKNIFIKKIGVLFLRQKKGPAASLDKKTPHQHLSREALTLSAATTSLILCGGLFVPSPTQVPFPFTFLFISLISNPSREKRTDFCS
jgi:hypothetical protein